MIAQLFVVSFCTKCILHSLNFLLQIVFLLSLFPILLFEIKFCWAFFCIGNGKRNVQFSFVPFAFVDRTFLFAILFFFYGDKRPFYIYLIMFFHLILFLPLQTTFYCINMFVFASLSSAKWNKNSSCLPAIYREEIKPNSFACCFPIFADKFIIN